jgi:hypothetical protein
LFYFWLKNGCSISLLYFELNVTHGMDLKIF